MGRLLRGLMAKGGFRLVKLEGGSRETAIASQTSAVIGIAGNAAAVAAEAERWADILKKEYAATESGLRIRGRADVQLRRRRKRLFQAPCLPGGAGADPGGPGNFRFDQRTLRCGNRQGPG